MSENYRKINKSSGTVLEQWRRVFFMRHRHWRWVDSRTTAGNAQTGGSGLLSSIPFSTGCEEHHHLQSKEKHNKQSIFVGFRSV